MADLFKLSGNQKTYVKYAIYKDEQFSNDVKLKMALGQVKDSEIKSEGNNKTISKETVDKYLGESFENLNGISYSDVELFNDDTFSNYYNIDRYVYNQNNSEYEVVESGINEKEPPLINEVIKKAVKKGNKIEVYVVPLFIKTYEFNIDNQTGMAYQFYGSYNYSGKSFESPLYLASNGSEFAITGDTYRQELLSNNTADGYNYQNVHDNIKDFDNLQVYKYTYTKDSNSGKYHITSFEKANENNNNNDNNGNSDNNSNNTGNQ